MYIYIQTLINRIMIALLAMVLAIIIGLYHLFYQGKIALVGFVFLTVLLLFLNNYLIRFLEQNLEHRTIYRMLCRKQIALATVHDMTFYKESRDSSFHTKPVFKIHLTVKTPDQKSFQTDIYEAMSESGKDCLPGEVFVTWDGSLERITVIPTFLLQTFDDLEPEVRKLEKMYHPSYIVAIRKKGLQFKSVRAVMHETDSQ